MAHIILPHRFRSQPQTPTRLSGERRGLRFAFHGPTRTLLVRESQRFASSDTAVAIIGTAGRGGDYSGSANTQFAYSSAFAIGNGGLSIGMVFDVDTLGNYSPIFAHQDSSTGPGYEFRLGVGSSDSRLLSHRAGASQFTEWYASASDLIAAGSKNVRLMLVWPDADQGNAPTYYLNGVAYTGTYSGGNGFGTATASTQAMWIGRRSDGATQLDGAVYHLSGYDRALKSAEAIEWCANPWGDYAPIARRIYLPSAAAGGDVTAELSGVSATAATGSLSITGASNLTLTGVSATASVGDVTVSVGTNVSVDLTGTSVTAAVGTLAVTGGASVSPTGNEAITSIGSITMTGGAVVSLTGESVTASVGTVTVDTGGNITVSTTGVSATAAVGSVTVTGNATVTLTGVSGAGEVGSVSFAGDVEGPVLAVTTAGGGGARRARVVDEYVVRIGDKDYVFGTMEEALDFLNAQRLALKPRIEEAAQKAAKRIMRQRGKGRPPKKPALVSVQAPQEVKALLKLEADKIERDFDLALAEILMAEAEVKDIMYIIGQL